MNLFVVILWNCNILLEYHCNAVTQVTTLYIHNIRMQCSWHPRFKSHVVSWQQSYTTSCCTYITTWCMYCYIPISGIRYVTCTVWWVIALHTWYTYFEIWMTTRGVKSTLSAPAVLVNADENKKTWEIRAPG